MTELSLSAAIGEIEEGPNGPGSGAFFDLDGTLVEGYTARFFLEARLRSRQIGRSEIIRTARVGTSALLGRADFDALLDASSKASAGRTDEEVREMADRIFVERTEPRVVAGVRQLVEAHRERGHTIVLASSATNYQAEPVARALEIDHVICNRMVVDAGGVLTGEVVRPVIWGEGKARAIRDLAHQLELDLAASYFYADGAEDEALMHLVGHPRPVNPKPRLAAVAARRGWPIVRVSSSAPPGLSEQIRTVLGLASLLPASAAGVTTGVLRWNKRAGINAAGGMWLDSLLRVNGVSVHVVSGREHLVAPRPAVFIFNHKNNFDPFIVASLVRTDFTGVGKKELEKDPIMGTIGRLTDMVFIDRDNPREAVRQLQDMEILVRKGLSVIIAPEGTRSHDGKLGSFKKGAFRIAMATGLPIVPIVVRNAEVVGDRDATVMRSGTVDVAVLSPGAVDHWTTQGLTARIRGVQDRFAETLRRWPA